MSATLPYKNIFHQNEWHLRLVAHISPKLSQNVCLINIYIFIYRHARYYCKLWNALWLYYVFWAYSYIIIDYSCLNCCISTKLALIMCLINTHILIYWHARCHSKLWNTSWFHSVFFVNFSHNWWIFMSEVLYIYQSFTDCLSIHLLWYVDIPDVNISYGRFPVTCNLFLWKFQFLIR